MRKFMKINIGDKIEDIELPDSYGNIFKLSSTKGKKVLLTFYRHASCAVCNLRINEFVKKYQPDVLEKELFFWQEFVLWGLVEYKKLSKHRYSEGTQFKDPYGSFISKL